MKIALLSNVNMDFVIRRLKEDFSVYEAEGYGNELGTLLNPSSSYHAFAPDITFLVEDLMELTGHELDPERAAEPVERWFSDLEGCIKTDVIYYISDAYLWGIELGAVHDTGRKAALEGIWQERLARCVREHANVRILPYRRLIEALGEERAFSLKMWYLGKILLSSEAQESLCRCIRHLAKVEGRTPKKVLLLDLDNTLWGGLAGEADHTPITLSEEKSGLAYKNLQRVLLQMQRQGVLLGIVSKNNAEDVQGILAHHPHMVLKPEHFAAQRINWEPKHENIAEIAKELNLGLDSFVFFDDHPAERALVKELLPQVEVPDFPERPEELAGAMVEIYRRFFEKAALTDEDGDKTRQYAANAERARLKSASGSFEAYLEQLHITLRRVEPASQVERLTQLVNKTNQFNLTTRRYTQAQILQTLEDESRRVYLYQAADRFGDSGVIAAVIVDLGGEIPEVEEFAMSCRVMGRNIEYAILEDVERDLLASGFERLRGSYLPTLKNKPVQGLYGQAGYHRVGEAPGGGAVYEIEIAKAPRRVYYVEREEGERGKER